MGRKLARLQAALLLNHGAGYHFGRVDTKSNVIADGISRIPSESSLSNNFPFLLTQAPSLLGCRRFLPNAGIVSLIVDILLRTASWDPLTVSRQLLTDPGRFISYHGAMTYASQTPVLRSSHCRAATGSWHVTWSRLLWPHHHRGTNPVRHAPR
jgi:hypothetical protein